MSHSINLPQRRSLRLADYDYRLEGAYFVTLCTHARACLSGEIEDGVVHLSEIGRIASNEWARSATIRHEIVLDEFVVMPNHLHGIIYIVLLEREKKNDQGSRVVGEMQVGRGGRPPDATTKDGGDLAGDVVGRHSRRRSLGACINGYKAAVTREAVARGLLPAGTSLWQRNYYEHVIRNDAELQRVRSYIVNNPARWSLDRENPMRSNGK